MLDRTTEVLLAGVASPNRAGSLRRTDVRFDAIDASPLCAGPVGTWSGWIGLASGTSDDDRAEAAWNTTWTERG